MIIQTAQKTQKGRMVAQADWQLTAQ